jgi:phosphoglycerate kinase
MEINNNKILIRCDFNEPIKDGELLSTKRIDANLSTIYELLSKKNKVILISHHSDKSQTMLPVFNYIKKTLNQSHPKLNFIYLNTIDKTTINEYFRQNRNNLPEIILLENTRLFVEEKYSKESVKSPKNKDESNDLNFAKFLSSLGNYFVYDAFSVGHRDHASTTGVAKLLPSFFGLTFQKEYSGLKKLLDEADQTLAFMGGAKLSTKLPIVEKLINKGSIICLGGAMIHDILKHKGLNIKDSYLEQGFELSGDVIDKLNTEIRSEKLILPKELIWNKTSEEAGIVKIVDNFFDTKEIKDILVKNNIKNILWNGPVGMYEDGEVSGSREIYNFIKDTTLENKKTLDIFTIVGGGDTLTFLENEGKNFEQDFSYVSLSGGAMLTFLSEGTLPILKVIK